MCVAVFVVFLPRLPFLLGWRGALKNDKLINERNQDRDTHSNRYQAALQSVKHGCGKGPWDHFTWQGLSLCDIPGSTVKHQTRMWKRTMRSLYSTRTLTLRCTRQHCRCLNMDVEKDHEITLPDKDTHPKRYKVALERVKHGCGKGPGVFCQVLWELHGLLCNKRKA